MQAAEASIAAHAQGKFWQMSNKIFDAAPLLTSDNVAGYLAQFAEEIGLDMERYHADVSSRRFLPLVEADIARGEELGVKGVPVFFINGDKLGGAQPFDKFKEVIDRHLANSTDAQCRLFAL